MLNPRNERGTSSIGPAGAALARPYQFVRGRRNACHINYYSLMHFMCHAHISYAPQSPTATHDMVESNGSLCPGTRIPDPSWLLWHMARCRYGQKLIRVRAMNLRGKALYSQGWTARKYLGHARNLLQPTKGRKCVRSVGGICRHAATQHGQRPQRVGRRLSSCAGGASSSSGSSSSIGSSTSMVPGASRSATTGGAARFSAPAGYEGAARGTISTTFATKSQGSHHSSPVTQ